MKNTSKLESKTPTDLSDNGFGGDYDFATLLLRGVIENTSDAILVLKANRDRSGEISDFSCMMANSAALSLAAGSPASLTGKDLFVLFPQFRHKFAADMLKTALDSGRPAGFCLRITEEEEYGGWLEVSARKVSDDFLSLSFRNCGDNIALRRALQEKEEFFEGICVSVPFGIITIDCRELEKKKLWVTGFNAAAGKFFNIDLDIDLKNGEQADRVLEIASLLPGEVYEDLLLQIGASLDQKVTVTSEVAIKRDPDDDEHFYEFVLSPVFRRDGSLQTMLCMVFDETERKLAERLANQSQRLQAIGQLTGGIAHDFNNRLTVITGNLELLELRLKDQPENLKLLHEAISSAFSSSLLTQHLLAFSRRQALKPAKIDVNEQIDSILAMLGRSLGEQLSLCTQFAEDLWPIFVDIPHFETAIVNFALNARDAMPAGGVLTFKTQNVWLTQQDTGKFADLGQGPYVRIDVSDTGTGIPPDLLPHVLDPFFTTKEVGKGTGLGLSSAYGFARQSKGGVHIESVVGEGTTVSLFLPRYESSTIHDRGITDYLSEPAESAKPLCGKGEKVLVVEDDYQLRKLVGQMLVDLNYKVTEAENAADALRVLEAVGGKLDIALIDNIMPGGMKGIELMKLAKKKYPALKVLLTTGYSSELTEPGAKISPGTPVLVKPYKLTTLAQALRQLSLNTAHHVS